MTQSNDPNNSTGTQSVTSTWSKKIVELLQGQSIPIMLFLLGLLGGTTFDMLSSPAYRQLKDQHDFLQKKLEARETELAKLNKELDGIESISIPNILSASSKEDVYDIRKGLPQDVSRLIKEQGGDVKNVVYATYDTEEKIGGVDRILEVRIKFGESLAYRNIKEYDFICRETANESSSDCIKWSLQEIEEPITFADINDDRIKDKIREMCQRQWHVLQVEKSTSYAYDTGGLKETSPVYEVTCIISKESKHANVVDWQGQEVLLKTADNGEISVKVNSLLD